MKAINQQTGAFVEISRQLPPNGDPNFKLFVIRGSPQQIDHAKQLIEEKIEVRSWVLVKVPCLLGLLTAAVTFSLRVPSAQLDQALGDQALLDPWGLSTLDPSTRGLQGRPHMLVVLLLTSTRLRAGAIPTPSGSHLPLTTQVSVSTT